MTDPIFCYDSSKAIAVFPAENFSAAYVMDYPRTGLRGRVVDAVLEGDRYVREIAPARTFCTAEEAEQLRPLGYGRGASAENTLVIEPDGTPRGDTFRLDDECARHKLLDLIGDLTLLGFSVRGRVVALRSGHALNLRLVGEIKKQRESLR